MKPIYSSYEPVPFVVRLNETGLTLVTLDIIDPSTDEVVVNEYALAELDSELGTYYAAVPAASFGARTDRAFLYTIYKSGDVAAQGEFFRGGLEDAWLLAHTQSVTIAAADIPDRNIVVGMVERITYTLPFGKMLVMDLTYNEDQTEVDSTAASVV